MNALIVDDEFKLASFVESGLHAEGHNCFLANDRDSLLAYRLNSHFLPDAIILDRLLHGVDVLDQIPSLRACWPEARIVVLSAIGGPRDRAKALNLGADDYMNKPFDIEELLARLKVAERKVRPLVPIARTPDTVRVNDDLKDLEFEGRRCGLNNKEFMLAKMFIENPNKVYNRFRLLDIVWGYHSEVESNVVEVTVSHLRKKIPQESGLKIMSRRNTGYWLEI
jgi:DNA-binding response OmpR family regulator